MASATPIIDTSPTPFAPALLNWKSARDKFHVDRTDVRVHGQHVLGEIGVQESAIMEINLARFAQGRPDVPHHATTWLAAVRGPMTRPQSATPTTRRTLMRRVPGSTRTSTKCAM
jgi:hypothetical protein